MKSQLGYFDSGIGGFSVLRSVSQRHGDLPTLYFADTSRVPYGTKSKKEIRLIAREIIDWFNYQDVKAVLVACNTTNSLALDVLEEYSNVPIFGLIESVQDIVEDSRIGVLATPLTVSSKAYTNQILKFRPDTFVLEQACPEFVPFIETGQLNCPELKLFAKEYLKPLLNAGVESIVLGCSHYPFLKPLLTGLLPKDVRLLDPSEALAKKLDGFVVSKGLSNQINPTYSYVRFCVTSNPAGFAGNANQWLGLKPEVDLISLKSNACVS